MKYYDDGSPILECDSLNHMEETYDLFDARGLFCATVCDKCVGKVKAKYRAEIFQNPNYDMPEDDLYSGWGKDEEESDDWFNKFLDDWEAR